MRDLCRGAREKIVYGPILNYGLDRILHMGAIGKCRNPHHWIRRTRKPLCSNFQSIYVIQILAKGYKRTGGEGNRTTDLGVATTVAQLDSVSALTGAPPYT